MDNFSTDFIFRILNNRASKEERRLLKDWIDSDENNKKTYFDYKRIWMLNQMVKLDTEQSEVEAQYQHFKNRINKKELQKRKKNIRLNIFKYAAVFIGMIILGVSGYMYLKPNEMVDYIVADNISIKEVILNDGTRIYIKGNSKLRFPKKFSYDNRYVEVEGQAFFNVKSDSLHPFVVNLGDINVRVLGTSFNVRNDSIVEAILEEGKISLTSNDGKVLADMRPGERIRYIKGLDIIDVDRVNTEVYTSWRFSQIILDNKALFDIIAEIEKYYKVKIKYNNNKYINRNYRFIIDKRMSLSETLRQLDFIVPLEYRISGKEVEVRFESVSK